MLILLWLFFISKIHDTSQQVYHKEADPLTGDDLESAKIILNTTADLIHDSNERVARLYPVRVDNMKTAPFEVGYLVHKVMEKYRKMVDKYTISSQLRDKLYIMEHVMYLEEIEHLYFEIEHLVNMAHEIERKYKIMQGLDDDYRDHEANLKTVTTTMTTPMNPYLITIKKKKKNITKWTPTKRPPKSWFPMEYGWSVEGLP